MAEIRKSLDLGNGLEDLEHCTLLSPFPTEEDELTALNKSDVGYIESLPRSIKLQENLTENMVDRVTFVRQQFKSQNFIDCLISNRVVEWGEVQHKGKFAVQFIIRRHQPNDPPKAKKRKATSAIKKGRFVKYAKIFAQDDTSNDALKAPILDSADSETTDEDYELETGELDEKLGQM